MRRCMMGFDCIYYAGRGKRFDVPDIIVRYPYLHHHSILANFGKYGASLGKTPSLTLMSSMATYRAFEIKWPMLLTWH